MTGAAVMIQGTGSNVGKSVVVAGLCRAATRRGLKVAPFKPQNMSNNAAVCADGGEIGRAQALQARAAGVAPSVHHNPVLLKPENDRGSQLVVHGRVAGHLHTRRFAQGRRPLLEPVLQSFERLARSHDLVIVEGAGSPAEVNLRAGDIANMGFARAAGVPVVLLADIDRGGAIASVVGTQAVLSPEDSALIKAFAINRFRGDPALFDDGVGFMVERTGWPCFGVIPWLDAVRRLPAEDAVDLESVGLALGTPTSAVEPLCVAVPLLSRVANFDDLDPLRLEPNVDVRFTPPGRRLPRDADVIVLLGTKSTIADLQMLREQGWAEQVHDHVRRGGWVTGLCGGLQMLGCQVADPEGRDGTSASVAGLGLLDLRTRMHEEKRVRASEGYCAESQAPVRGYEIHVGASTGPDVEERPMLVLDGEPDGARSRDARVEGCYLHGLFHSDEYRRAWLERRRPGSGSDLAFEATVEAALDELAEALEEHLDIDSLLAIAQSRAGDGLR